jgi:hypothetical protein
VSGAALRAMRAVAVCLIRLDSFLLNILAYSFSLGESPESVLFSLNLLSPLVMMCLLGDDSLDRDQTDDSENVEGDGEMIGDAAKLNEERRKSYRAWLTIES